MQSYSIYNAYKVNIAVAISLLYVPLMGYIGGLFGQGMVYNVLQVIYLITFLMAFPSAVKCLNRKIALFVSAYTFLLILSYLMATDTNVFRLVLNTIFLWCVPYFILSFSIRNYEDLLVKLKYVSILMIILGYLRTFTLAFSSDTYSQDLGYDVLLPFIVYFISYIKDKKIWYLIPIIISLALIFMSGSRGPLLCAMAGAALAYSIIKGINIRDIYSFSLLFIAYVIYSVYRIEILTWILDIFNSINVSVRSIELLLYDDITNDDARDKLRSIATNYILEHPILGSGFINDRVYIYSNYVMNKTATVYGSYCHNFFLEILMQFGLLSGIIIITIFIRKMVFTFKYAISQIEREYLIVITTIGIFPLLVSRSWITFHLFYMVLGTLLVSNKNKTIWHQ